MDESAARPASPRFAPLRAVVPRPSSAPAAADRADGAGGALAEGVRALQARLNRFDYRDAEGRPLRVDGIVGERTREALVEFQRAHGLRPDGVAGPRTVSALLPDAAPAGADGDDATSRLLQAALAHGAWRAHRAADGGKRRA